MHKPPKGATEKSRANFVALESISDAIASNEAGIQREAGHSSAHDQKGIIRWPARRFVSSFACPCAAVVGTLCLLYLALRLPLPVDPPQSLASRGVQPLVIPISPSLQQLPIFPSLPPPILPFIPSPWLPPPRTLTPPPPPARPPWPERPYKLFTGRRGYRFADMFLWFNGFKGWAVPHHVQTWPDSLVAKYAHATQTDRNYEVMADIIRREPGEAAEADLAVIHLRVGDVFEDTAHALGFIADLRGVTIENNWSVPDFFNGRGPFPEWYSFLWHYTFNRSFYEEHLGALRAFGIRKVVLMAGAHIPYPSYPRSSEYVDLVRDWFFSEGFEVTSRLGGDPDDDVVFAARAKFFVQSGGGFSAVLANLCGILGGTVLCSGRQFACDPDTWSRDKVGRRMAWV